MAAFNYALGDISMIRLLYKAIIKAVEVVSIVGIALIVVFTGYEVFIREIFGKPTNWTNEITSYLLVWVGLLGVVYAYDRGTHVSVDLVFRHFNGRTQRFLNIITAFLTLLFGLCIGIYGYKYWWVGYSAGWNHFGILGVPMSYTQIALPITGVLLVFQVAITLYDHIRAFRSKGREVWEESRRTNR
jgi:TRAP-type C4-dicarboxylate transport system permease small subunit